MTTIEGRMSKKKIVVTGKLRLVSRTRNTNKGNLRYELRIGDIKFLTKPDDNIVHRLIKYLREEVEVELRSYYGKLVMVSIKLVEVRKNEGS